MLTGHRGGEYSDLIRRLASRFHGSACTLLLLALSASGPAGAALDLANVQRVELDNGLTVLLLVDRNFPVASVQMLYKVGARNEITGRTGLAHFLEHMAFRATRNFPDTDVVSRVYGLGGEWHGYTWTDQTTYYSTVPREDLDLLLRIEADRMTRLELDPASVEAERGAVLAEMHMYENWPSSMLLDALMVTAFQAHPYRNNTIGWESDIEHLAHDDIVAFYREHYHPANAILAVVGDVDPDAVTARVEALFGKLPARAPTPPPHTLEPPQQGERRVSVSGTSPGKRFMMAWRAPGTTHPGFAPFLVLQELLAGGSGVSFLQNDWGTPAREGRALHGAVGSLTSWYPPSEQDYLFVVGGRPRDGDDERNTEAALDERLRRFLEAPPSEDAVAAAVAAIRRELAFDVETTEDAAHQLAFFEGIGALDVLLTLPARLEAVAPDDVLAVAREYLAPARRTIAWYRPGAVEAPTPLALSDPTTAPTDAGPVDETPAEAPVALRLQGGVPVVLQASDLSPTVEVRLLVPGNALSAPGFVAQDPGVLALTARGLASKFPGLVREAGAVLENARHVDVAFTPSSLDPETRLAEEFAAIMRPWSPAAGTPARPAVIAVAGDVDADAVMRELGNTFGDHAAATLPKIERAAPPRGVRNVALGVPVAQSQLGYVVAAPGPRDDDWLATRLLLYIFAHGYEGRFGKEAISRRGLAYYVDARYTSNGGPGWITLGVGVDPPKMADLVALLRAELDRLAKEPPSEREVAEARQHLLGRAVSAAQSNGELTEGLARHWLWNGEVPSVGKLEQALAAVSRDDVLAAIPAFTNGLTLTVTP